MMAGRSGSVFCRISLILAAVMSAVKGICPDDAIKRAMNCTDKLGQLGIGPSAKNGGPSIFSNGADTEKVAQACRNGDPLTAINCIERVMEECKNDNTDGAHYLRKMVDTERARKSVKFFCNNIKVYIANAECIVQHHKDVDTCAQETRNTFQVQAGATANMDVLMKFQCPFFQAAKTCSEKVLKEKCSPEAGNLVKIVIEGFKPPNCATGKTDAMAERQGAYDVEDVNIYENENSARIFNVSVFVLIIGLCLLFLL